jgi:hypothetical protein
MAKISEPSKQDIENPLWNDFESYMIERQIDTYDWETQLSPIWHAYKTGAVVGSRIVSLRMIHELGVNSHSAISLFEKK